VVALDLRGARGLALCALVRARACVCSRARSVCACASSLCACARAQWAGLHGVHMQRERVSVQHAHWRRPQRGHAALARGQGSGSARHPTPPTHPSPRTGSPCSSRSRRPRS
jgi:hypothetical protein